MDERDEPTHPVAQDLDDTQQLPPEALVGSPAGTVPTASVGPGAPPPIRSPGGARSASASPTAVEPPPGAAGSRGRTHLSPWLLGGAAAGAALAALVWLLVAVVGSPGDSPVPAAPAAGPRATPAAATERLRDRDGVITLYADGRLEGLDAVAPNVRRAVVETLRDGRLPDNPELAAALAKLRSPAPTEVGVARPIAPVGVRLLTDQPRFSWSEHPAAVDYEVTIVDRLGNPLFTSPRLRALAWEPPRPLPRGRPLAWRLVTRVRRGETEPSVVEGRFALVSAEDLAWLDREIRAARDSSLVSAVLYAELGALDDCHAALVELARLNPQAVVVGRLLADLQRRRGG